RREVDGVAAEQLVTALAAKQDCYRGPRRLRNQQATDRGGISYGLIHVPGDTRQQISDLRLDFDRVIVGAERAGRERGVASVVRILLAAVVLPPEDNGERLSWSRGRVRDRR